MSLRAPRDTEARTSQVFDRAVERGVVTENPIRPVGAENPILWVPRICGMPKPIRSCSTAVFVE
jgi:hypothetical protein